MEQNRETWCIIKQRTKRKGATAKMRWIILDTTYKEHLRRLRKNTPDILRFVAQTRNGVEVVVAPPLEALRLVSTGEIDVVSEPVWRLFSPDQWCLVQKLLFHLLDEVTFVVTTNDLTVVPPPNVIEDSPSNWAINYDKNVKIIIKGADYK
jgi:hypothetical protein